MKRFGDESLISGLDGIILHTSQIGMSCNSEPLSEGKMAPLLISSTNHGTFFV